MKVQIGSSGQPGLIGSLLKEIEKKTGYKESDVIKIMRRSLNHPHLDYGEKEFTKKVSNIEKNLNIQENK